MAGAPEITFWILSTEIVLAAATGVREDQKSVAMRPTCCSLDRSQAVSYSLHETKLQQYQRY